MTYGNYPDLTKIKNILVVKLRNHGDVLLSSPVYTMLKKALPEAHIDAYIYQDSYPMLEGHPSIDGFIFAERRYKGPFWRRFIAGLGILFAIVRKRYDLVINLTEGDRGALATLFSFALYSVGVDRGGKRILGKKKIYTHTIKGCPTPRHAVEKDLDALRCIGIFPEEKERELLLTIPESSFTEIEAMIPRGVEYIVIHPVSRWRFKCLPEKTIAEVISYFVRAGLSIVVTGSTDPQELAICKMIQDLVGAAPLYNLCGMLTMKQLSAVIARALCLVTVDSVSLHIASACKTPVVALFGPTSEKHWGPWQHPQAKVVTQNLPCRPCLRDGCAGSKMSDCLFSLKAKIIVEETMILLSQPRS
jgi:heptosyltransferase-3